jgi:peptidoglycan/LPS O-acetylase OafA/YrhL
MVIPVTGTCVRERAPPSRMDGRRPVRREPTRPCRARQGADRHTRAPAVEQQPQVDEPAPPAATKVPHRNDLQGLRAVAVLLVVFAHCGVGFLHGGYVGVDVFFVLSGFLITGLLLAEARARGSVSLVEFYVRRARRILPAAALTLLVTDVAAVFFLNFLRARGAVEDSLHAAGFAANFHFAERGVDYFAQSEPPSPLLHYWSLSVEEQFYLVWPLLLSIALLGAAVLPWARRADRRHERRLMAVVIVLAGGSLAWSIHLTSTVPAEAYFSPFTRAWELGLGATLAVAAVTLQRAPPVAHLVMGWAGLVAIAFAAVLYSDRTPFPGSFALLPAVGTALAIMAGMGTRASRLSAGRLLAVRPMQIVGDRSYALYLWHWPVLILAAQYAGHDLSVTTKLGLMAGAFVLSCVSYALVEDPIRRRMRSRALTGVVVVVFMGALVGTAAVSLAAIDREQRRFEAPAAAGVAPAVADTTRRSIRVNGALPAVVAAVRAARRGAPIPSGLNPPIGQVRNFPTPYMPPQGCIARDSTSGRTSKICRVGRASSRRLIVLMGDSHALMWLPALLEMAWHDDWAVVPLLRLGCTPDKWISDRGSDTCREWYRWALGQAGQLHPQVTLIGGSVGEEQTSGTEIAAEGVIAAARALEPAGTVVVIGDPEGLGQDPVDCLLSRHASMARCTTNWPASSLAAYDGVARDAKQAGVRFLSTRGFLCFERQCPAVIGHTIAYMDDNHMTVAYSVQIAGAFRAAFLQVVPRTRR